MSTGKIQRVALAVAAAALLGACGGGGGDGDGNGGGDQQALIDEIAARFPYVANQPLDQVFYCLIAGSGLDWFLDFHADGTIDLYTSLDTGQDVFDTGGTYTHQNGQLSIDMVNNAVNLQNQVSNRLETAMGMVSRFTTQALDCHVYGHRYNAGEFGALVHYQCPVSNIQAVSQDVNAIEFVHAAMPFSVSVPGSAFRQRDRQVSGALNPLIQRGYGIYRRDGDRVFAYFANRQFDDFDYLSGWLGNADSELALDQAAVARAACPRT